MNDDLASSADRLIDALHIIKSTPQLFRERERKKESGSSTLRVHKVGIVANLVSEHASATALSRHIVAIAKISNNNADVFRGTRCRDRIPDCIRE